MEAILPFASMRPVLDLDQEEQGTRKCWNLAEISKPSKQYLVITHAPDTVVQLAEASPKCTLELLPTHENKLQIIQPEQQLPLCQCVIKTGPTETTTTFEIGERVGPAWTSKVVKQWCEAVKVAVVAVKKIEGVANKIVKGQVRIEYALKAVNTGAISVHVGNVKVGWKGTTKSDARPPNLSRPGQASKQRSLTARQSSVTEATHRRRINSGSARNSEVEEEKLAVPQHPIQTRTEHPPELSDRANQPFERGFNLPSSSSVPFYCRVESVEKYALNPLLSTSSYTCDRNTEADEVPQHGGSYPSISFPVLNSDIGGDAQWTEFPSGAIPAGMDSLPPMNAVFQNMHLSDDTIKTQFPRIGYLATDDDQMIQSPEPGSPSPTNTGFLQQERVAGQPAYQPYIPRQHVWVCELCDTYERAELQALDANFCPRRYDDLELTTGPAPHRQPFWENVNDVYLNQQQGMPREERVVDRMPHKWRCCQCGQNPCFEDMGCS
jgi:hypothetical protein